MIIKIPVKKSDPSNKPKTVLKTDGLHPFIDKISIVITPHDDETAHDIFKAVFQQIDDKLLFVDVNNSKFGNYKIAKRLKLSSIVDFKKWPLFQFAYDKEKELAISIRLEFVPVDLGAVGIFELHVALNSVMPDGWEYVVNYGHVTRIDIAVDIYGIQVDGFMFLPKQAASVTRWAKNGTLESYCIGKSKGNQTKIYDRVAKRLANNQDWPTEPCVRVERKLINLKAINLESLKAFKNPFENMVLADNLPLPPDTPTSKEWEWTMFCDAVKVRGLTNALALLPNAKKAKFRKHIKSHPAPWWDPQSIWVNWLPMLDDLQITKIPDVDC